jgi:hypothetical protein
MPLRLTPESILAADGGSIELSTTGDPETAQFILRRLTEQFNATLKERLYRNLMGDMEREREYWWLDIRGREYMVMRCTAPEAPPGIFLAGPTRTRDDLTLFRAIAASFDAVERDRRSPLRKGWWRFWR